MLFQTQIEIQKQLEQQLHDSGHGIGMIEVQLLIACFLNSYSVAVR